MAAYKGQFEFKVVETSFLPLPDMLADAYFGLMFRHGTSNTSSGFCQGLNPSWDETFTIDYESGQSIRLGVLGNCADESFSLGIVNYDPASDIHAHNTTPFRTKLILESTTVDLTTGSCTFTTYITLAGRFINSSVALLDEERPVPSSPTQMSVSAYPMLPATPSSAQPYIESSGQTGTVTPAPQYPVNAEGIPWAVPAGQSDHLDRSAFTLKETRSSLSLTAAKRLDLHAPLVPSLYIGQKRMFMRALPDGKAHSNPEKGSENDTAQLSMVEYSINPALTAAQITQYNNDGGEANLWKPEDRYRGTSYDAAWRKSHPHAWAGPCDSITFYFSQPSSSIPSLLVGIDQVWSDAGECSNSLDHDGTLHFSYGYTPHSIKLQFHDTFPYNHTTIQSHTFNTPQDDYISGLDITSGKHGITSVRLLTANGVDSGLIFHRGSRTLAQDGTLYSDLKALDGRSFQHDMVHLHHDSSSQHSALAYFCVYERPVLDASVKSHINNDPASAQCDMTIGGLRTCASHPVKTSELSTKKWTQQQAIEGPNPTTLATVTPLTPLEVEDVNDVQKNTAVTSGDDITAATFVNTSANYTSSSTPYSASQGAKAAVISNNVSEFSGWGFILVSNILFLGAIAIVMTLWTKEISLRTAGPTSCTAFESKANMLWVIIAVTYLFVAFFFAFIIAWIVCATTGCIRVGDRAPLYVYNVATFIYAILSVTFASVAMAWVFKIPLGCITYSERWILFSMYLLILCAFPGFMIALIVTRHYHYIWYHAIWLNILVNVFSSIGFAGLMIPICNCSEDGCLCCERD